MKSEVTARIADGISALGERIPANRCYGGGIEKAFYLIKHTSELLNKPMQNHEFSNKEAIVSPSIDRFVFSESDANCLHRNLKDELKYGYDCLFDVRPPVVPCWIEVSGKYGWLIVNEKQLGEYVSVISFGKHGDDISPILIFDWPKHNAQCELSGNRAYDYSVSHPGFFEKELLYDVISLMSLCACIGNNNISITKPISPLRMDGSAGSAAASRAFQHGRPMFSFNHVELVRPQTCEYRGEVVPSEFLVGKRGHFVVGHWRLIDGRQEPYWVWVDGHKRGDPSLGWVTKERQVILKQEVRRGFELPAISGLPGQRIPASPVKYQ